LVDEIIMIFICKGIFSCSVWFSH